MTQLTPIYFLSQWILVVLVIIWIFKKENWTFHIPFLFGLFVLQVFTGIAPFYFWIYGPSTILGYPYFLKFDLASSIYFYGVSAFTFAYLAFNSILKPKINEKQADKTKSKDYIYWLLGLLILCWIGVLINFHLSGVKLLEVFNFKNRNPEAMLFSIPIYNGFLEALANSFIAILLLIYTYSKKSIWVILLISAHIIFFFLAGWRFRILLTFIGIFIYYLPQIRFRQWWKWGIALTSAFVFMLWISQNRMAFSKRMFHLMSYSISDYDAFRIMHEVGNCRTFMATLHFIETNHISPDRGASLYLPILWRFQKAESFKGGLRPKPPLLELEKAWIPKDIKQNLNPGVSNLEEYYLSLGWLGMVVMMALFGLSLHLIPKSRNSSLSTGAQMVFTAFLFQFISRGYLPQQLKLLAFLSLPFLILNLVKTNKLFYSQINYESQS